MNFLGRDSRACGFHYLPLIDGQNMIVRDVYFLTDRNLAVIFVNDAQDVMQWVVDLGDCARTEHDL